LNPSTGQPLARVAVGNAADVDAAVGAAARGFAEWRAVLPLERGRILRRMAEVLRKNAAELAMIDAANCGNPVREMTSDAMVAAAQLDFFAGLVTEMKGASILMGPDVRQLLRARAHRRGGAHRRSIIRLMLPPASRHRLRPGTPS
jgi:betaine-aldehyde dehydrogenase